MIGLLRNLLLALTACSSESIGRANGGYSAKMSQENVLLLAEVCDEDGDLERTSADGHVEARRAVDFDGLTAGVGKRLVDSN